MNEGGSVHSADRIRRARKSGAPRPFRRRSVAALVAATVVGLAACGSSGSSSTGGSGSTGSSAPGSSKTACATPTGSYTFDVVSDVTGTLATSLGLGASGVKAYAQKINDEGGVNCKTIKVNVLDGQSNANTGAAQFRQATSDAPVAIMHFGLSTT